MQQVNDMETWRDHHRALLAEAEEARLARQLKEARPKRKETYPGKVRRRAALLLSTLGWTP